MVRGNEDVQGRVFVMDERILQLRFQRGGLSREITVDPQNDTGLDLLTLLRRFDEIPKKEDPFWSQRIPSLDLGNDIPQRGNNDPIQTGLGTPMHMKTVSVDIGKHPCDVLPVTFSFHGAGLGTGRQHHSRHRLRQISPYRRTHLLVGCGPWPPSKCIRTL